MDNTKRVKGASNRSSTNKNMQNNQIKHSLDVMKAAFPYLDNDSQQSMDFILKAGELMDSFQSLQHKDSVSTLSMQKQPIDIESLLRGIRDVLYEQERELVDMILNLIQAKNLYSTYMSFSQTMASDSEHSKNSKGNSGGGMNPEMMEVLGSFLTPEQKETFDNISMIMNAANT